MRLNILLLVLLCGAFAPLKAADPEPIPAPLSDAEAAGIYDAPADGDDT